MTKQVKEDFTKLTHKKGISLIVLIVTIIVIIILAAVVVLTINKNNPIESAKNAVILQDINNMQEIINVKAGKNKLENGRGITGKLEDFEELNEYVKKYNDLLYIKDNKLYLNFMTTIKSNNIYLNNKSIVDALNDKLDVCYDTVKLYNKVQNSSFDDGLNGYTSMHTKGNVTEILNENGNNYLHMAMKESAGNTEWVAYSNKNIANQYDDLIYTFVRYRNKYVESIEGYKINKNIIVLSRSGRGYDISLLDSEKFVSCYNLGWQNVSYVRKVESRTENLGLQFTLGGDMRFGSTWEYELDFDDLYMINLTEIFGKGNEPSKEEMDRIFSEIFK